ncbi:MAG: hypothetical protein CFK52_11385 [Chloracidobacterium sp. CP2_5A]|nr:MAG: hypothetical protein CFK52_11385 [Chloracidobacterium sp. CP2_5A]
MPFHLVQATIPPDAADAVSEAFWQAGAQGIETLAETEAGLTLRASFLAAPDAPALQAALEQTLAAFDYPAERLQDFSTEPRPYEDWLAKWKADWKAQPVGRRWLIVPPWRRDEARSQAEWAERIPLDIEPGMAFGTGTHETTRACLRLLEDLPSPRAILDIGTGTGILAIAAAKLFPQADCAACDTDPDAVAIALENARLNGVEGRVRLSAGSAKDFPASRFDLALANLTAEVIASLAPDLARVLRPGGKLIVAGVLTDRRAGVIATLSAVGLQLRTERVDGEWWAGLAEAAPRRPSPR